MDFTQRTLYIGKFLAKFTLHKSNSGLPYSASGKTLKSAVVSRPMLVGRQREVSALKELVADARRGQSGVLVIRGEPGSGKSALLSHVAAHADGIPEVAVLRTVGVQSESHLSYAGLAGLLRPILSGRELLSEQQRGALESALALGPPTAHDQLALAAATLGLLCAAAERQPLVVVVDDLHWIDPGSRLALLFACRRLGADSVAVLMSARDHELDDGELRGVGQLRLAGLASDDASRLLVSAGLDVAPSTVGVLVDRLGGNPLALLEVARSLDEAQRKGQRPIGALLPVGPQIESSYATALSTLSTAGGEAVVLIAAESDGDRRLLTEAASNVGVGFAAFVDVEAAGLIEITIDHIRFRHPLIRSVALTTTTPQRRTAAHRALAQCLADDSHREQRAWHLAAAASAPDEDVASLLESVANDAAARGDLSSAATGYERAAALSIDRTMKGQRMFMSGMAAANLRGAGDDLLRRAHDLASDPHVQADIVISRAMHANMIGDYQLADQIVSSELAGVEATDRGRAATLVACGSLVAWNLARFAEVRTLADRSMELLGEPGQASGPTLLAPVMALVGTVLGGNTDLSLTDPCLHAFRLGAPQMLAVPVLYALLYSNQLDAAATLLDEVRIEFRRQGLLASMAWIDAVSIDLSTRLGDFGAAYAAGYRSLDVLGAVDMPYARDKIMTDMATLDALAGAETSCRDRVETVRRATVESGADVLALESDYAIGLLDLGHGRYLAATGRLARLNDDLTRRGAAGLGIWPVATDLVEAAMMAGDTALATATQILVEERARNDSHSRVRMATLRSRAIAAEAADVDERFAEALASAREYPSSFEQARTRMAFGQRLLRDGRRDEARPHLGDALEQFEGSGARSWAKRARVELGDTGGAPSELRPSIADLLTSREQQVAALAISGATTREMSSTLFVSPKTIEAQLTSIYRKLGVRSKAQLAHVFGNRPTDGPTPG